MNRFIVRFREIFFLKSLILI